jgi:hypothetical protein
MQRIRSRLTYANAMATVAVFVALGGVGYAAAKLPRNSVGARQLKKEAVTPAKLSLKSKATLTGPAGRTGATGPRGPEGPRGLRGEKGETGNPGSSALLSTELKRDLTLRGRFNIDELATQAGQIHGDSISFGFTLAAAPTVEKIGSTPTANCPGNVEDPRAAPGFLCLYRQTESDVEFIGSIATPFGANLSVVAKTPGRFFYEGSWAVTGS